MQSQTCFKMIPKEDFAPGTERRLCPNWPAEKVERSGGIGASLAGETCKGHCRN